MEIENNNEQLTDIPEKKEEKSRGLLIFSIIFLIILLIIFGFFGFFAIQAPVKKAVDFQEKYRPKIDNPDEINKKSIEILALENEIAFQQSDISLSKNDSIYLIVDLVDSIISLEMQGVSLNELKIVDYKVSNFLKKLDPQILNNYISKPFKIKRVVSTIEKINIKTKIAPKNQDEANAQIADSIKPEKDFVRYSWFLDRDLVMEVVQDSIESNLGYKKLNSKMEMQGKIDDLKMIVDSALKFQPTKFTPTLKIVLSQKDARTIFRATPHNGLIVLRLGFKGMPTVPKE